MKHVLAALVFFLLVPPTAEAKLYAKRPAKIIGCDSRVTLGVASSPRHKGSRRVRVQIKRNGKIFYKRTVRAPLGDNYEWKKTLRPCGTRFTIVYIFPKGRIEFKTRVRLGTANPPPPDDPTPTPTPKLDPTPEQPPPVIPIPSSTPSPTPSPTPTPTPTPPPEEASTIRLQSGTETQLMRMVWWRGPPEIEGDHRVVGSCTWTSGDCVNGAPPAKTFRPQHFELIGFELWMDMPQYQGSAMTYSHYPIPVKLVRDGCTFQVQHGRAGGRAGGTLEFGDDPPGLEILPHMWTMTGDLCTTFDPLSTAWVSDLNTALATAIPPGPYIRPNYPY